MVLVCAIFLVSVGFLSYSLFLNPSDWFNNHQKTAIVAQIAGAFAFLCLATAYLVTMIRGPGYYPYNWSQTMKNEYTWAEMMNGVALFQEQVEFAKSHPQPARSSFSVNARRFVLRADHICGYMQSWIGFYNHKYFIQTTIWCAIYCIIYTLSQLSTIYEGIAQLFDSDRNTFEIVMAILILFTALFAIYITGFSLRHFFVAMKNLSHNITITEKYHKKSVTYDRGSACANCEEVCGSRWLLITWIFPFFFCYHPPKPRWEEDRNDGTMNEENPTNVL